MLSLHNLSMQQYLFNWWESPKTVEENSTYYIQPDTHFSYCCSRTLKLGTFRTFALFNIKLRLAKYSR
jgi:hypothetical protein